MHSHVESRAARQRETASRSCAPRPRGLCNLRHMSRIRKRLAIRPLGWPRPESPAACCYPTRTRSAVAGSRVDRRTHPTQRVLGRTRQVRYMHSLPVHIFSTSPDGCRATNGSSDGRQVVSLDAAAAVTRVGALSFYTKSCAPRTSAPQNRKASLSIRTGKFGKICRQRAA